MSDIQNKIDAAKKMLRYWCNEFDWNGYYLPGMTPNLLPQLCFSGGKDSVLTRYLCDIAGIKYHAVYSVTTIDPPPLVRFIKREFSDVEFHHSGTNFFREMVKRGGFPIRQQRWCCAQFKENTGNSFLRIIGVRAAESARRAQQWKTMTPHRNRDQVLLCPALHFSDAEVWEVIRSEGLLYCELYDQGFKRLGCIACPMATVAERKMQLEMFPGFDRAYRRAFSKIWDNRAGTISPKTRKEWFGSRKFKSSDDLFEWWIKDISSPSDLIKSGFEVDDIEGDGDLFELADSCDLGMF